MNSAKKNKGVLINQRNNLVYLFCFLFLSIWYIVIVFYQHANIYLFSTILNNVPSLNLFSKNKVHHQTIRVDNINLNLKNL